MIENVTFKDVNRLFRVTNTGWDSGDWECRVINWEGELYIRHEVGNFKGCVTPADSFNFNDCTWITDLTSDLTRAVQVANASKDLDLNFENLTDYFWSFDGDSITYSDLSIDILDDTGNAMCLEVRYERDSDENYIRYYVDNGCGDKYDAVFDRSKLVEVE